MINLIFLLIAVAGLNAHAATSAAADAAATAITISSSADGISLDDFFFDRSLGRVIVPDGMYLNSIDPKTTKSEILGAFPIQKDAKGRIGGVTSGDAGEGLIFTTDRTNRTLYAVDPQSRQIAASVSLSTGPDYVRYVEPTRELWVTEPRVHQIEIFSISGKGPQLTLAASGVIKIASDDGPEALAIDAVRGKAYTNSGGTTLVIGLKSREVISRWKNGCKGAEGLLLAGTPGFLIVACGEGKALALNVEKNGKIASKVKNGSGIDIMAYSPELGHLYLPGSKSATMAFVGLSNKGKLSLLGTVKTAAGAHCVAADDQGGAWVCNAKAGSLLYFKDNYPLTR